MKHCIEPGSIQDWELEAYADGIRIDRVSQHLADCDFCSARLRQLRQLYHVLETALHRLDCPSVDELRALRWKQLSPTRAALVKQHLTTCATCAQEATTFNGPMPEASASSPGWLERAFSVLVARLTPPRLTLLPALRGSAAQDIIYEVEEMGWEVMLTSLMESSGYSLAGQVLGPDPAKLSLGRATLLANGRLVQEVGLDATGWFELRGLPVGDCTLWLELSETRVEMPDIHLGVSLPPDS